MHIYIYIYILLFYFFIRQIRGSRGLMVRESDFNTMNPQLLPGVPQHKWLPTAPGVTVCVRVFNGHFPFPTLLLLDFLICNVQ